MLMWDEKKAWEEELKDLERDLEKAELELKNLESISIEGDSVSIRRNGGGQINIASGNAVQRNYYNGRKNKQDIKDEISRLKRMIANVRKKIDRL